MKTYKQKDVDRIIRTVNNIKETFITGVDKQLEKLQNLQPVEPEPERKEWRQKPSLLEPFYYIDDGDVEEATWEDNNVDEELYEAGNCFPCALFTEEQVQQIALMNQLNTLLYQYAIVNNALASEEEKLNVNKVLWYVASNYDSHIFFAKPAYGRHPCSIIFNNYKVINQAIEDVVKPFTKAHPEFIFGSIRKED